MGNYSITAIFTKDPPTIASAVRSVLYVLVLAGVLVWDEKILAGVALTLELLLALFVKGTTTSTAAPQLPVGTEVNAGSAVVASVTPPPEPVANVGDPTVDAIGFHPPRDEP